MTFIKRCGHITSHNITDRTCNVCHSYFPNHTPLLFSQPHVASGWAESFPAAPARDGLCHWLARAISLSRLEVLVDCCLLRRVPWRNYPSLRVSMAGIVLLGGATQPHLTPFTVRQVRAFGAGCYISHMGLSPRSQDLWTTKAGV